MSLKAADTSNSHGERKGFSLFLLCFGVFMIYLDGTIVNVALPNIQRDLGTGMHELQWVIDAYAIAFACLLLTAGTIGDALGHKKVFLAGLIGFTLSSVLCAVAPSIDVLLIGRALQGAFGSVVIPVSLAVIRGMYDEPAARAKAIGIWAALGGVALAAGPVAGGWLVEAQGWQSVFWVNLPIGAIVSLALIAKMKATPADGSRSIDWLGQSLIILCIAALTFGMIEGNSRGWNDSIIIGSFALSALSLLAFVAWELRHPSPLLPLRLFRNRIFLAACLVNFTAFFGLFGVLFLLTLYLQNVNGLSAIDTGVRFLALTVSIMIASSFASSLAQRISPRTLVPFGSLLAAAALFAMTGIDADSGYASYGWALALLGIGVAIVGTSATIALMTSMPPANAGAASGIANTFRQLSAVVAVALSGSLIAGPHNAGAVTGAADAAVSPFIDGMGSALFLASVVCLAGGVISVFLLRNNSAASRSTLAAAETNRS
ncbi:DHA2 family efflux MFS transporter permease subunit [Cohnella endophytica]|nr:DHA2 family efflux MFS transporter permease subunit [Cohnella endophytica]